MTRVLALLCLAGALTLAGQVQQGTNCPPSVELATVPRKVFFTVQSQNSNGPSPQSVPFAWWNTPDPSITNYVISWSCDLKTWRVLTNIPASSCFTGQDPTYVWTPPIAAPPFTAVPQVTIGMQP